MFKEPAIQYADVMIDLETLALSVDAHILRIGAVIVFLNDPTASFGIASIFDVAVSPTGQNRKVDPETVAFHFLHTSQEAKENSFAGAHPGHEQLTSALYNFFGWLSTATKGYELRVWSKGVDFDIAIIEHAAKQHGLKLPWNYKQRNCFRTMVSMFPEVVPPNGYGTHSALNDAKHQAEHLWRIHRFLTGDITYVRVQES